MSRSTNREYSSTDLSSVNGYRTMVRPPKATTPAQPLLAYCPSECRFKNCESKKDSISEVTLNNTIYSSKTTPRRRVIACKNTNDEEMITYHLKLKPESLRYTFSTTEPKKIVYADTLSDNQGTSRVHHARKRELSSRDSVFSQNCQHGNSRVKSYEEKTTNCRPVINLHTVEFIERTIDKNNRLKRLVRDIVEAREKEKQLEAWNNYINELKNKHANYYEYLDVPTNYQIECNNTFCHYKVPCQCTLTRPWSSVNNDNCDVSKNSDYIMNLYPNEISCYPISSAAYKSKNKTNELPRKSYLKPEYIINAEEENPQKRKRRQLNNDQVRNISAQTSTGIGTTSNDTGIRNQTTNEMKDEIEGYEPCVCPGEMIRDIGTNTDKVEQETLTDLTSKACFCNEVQETVHNESKKTADDNVLHDVSVGGDTSALPHEVHSRKTATYVTVTEKMSKLQEELGQSKTCDNSFGIIEEKLDNIISTMNDLLSEVKLRITDMGTDKFDSATSTTFPLINDKLENCVAHRLLEQEINFPDLDNATQSERYDFELFKRDKQTINTVQYNPKLTPTENINSLKSAADNANLSSIKMKTQGKALKVSNGSKSDGEQPITLAQPVGDVQPITLAQPKDDQSPTIERSVIDLKKVSKTFMDSLERSKPNLTEDEKNKKSETIGSRLREMFNINSHQEKPSKEHKQQVDFISEENKPKPSKEQKQQLDPISKENKGKSSNEPKQQVDPISEESKAKASKEQKQPVDPISEENKAKPSKEHKQQVDLISDDNTEKHSKEPKQQVDPISEENKAKPSTEHKQQVDSISKENKVRKENSDPNHSDNKKNSKKTKKDQEFCCVYASLRSIPRPRYRHASVTASLDRQISNATEIILDVYYSNNAGNDQTINKLVDRAVSKIDDNIMNTNGKSNDTKLRTAVDRAVSKIDENIFSVNHQQNYVYVDRAVSKIDDIIIEEMNKSNQAKKDINEILNREFTNNYDVQISFELPTKERGTEVTDSLSKTRISSTSSSQGKIYYARPSRTTPLTIAAVNTDPMSLLGLFRLSTNTMRQLLTFINFDYSSYLPSASRALPTISEAVQYLCHICGATFRRPSELSNHMKDHNLNSAKDCCVCRHMLQLRQRHPGVFACRFCGQSFTRAYCCELHERTCGRRRGRRLDVSDSRAILT